MQFSRDGIHWTYESPNSRDFKDDLHKAAQAMGVKIGETIHCKNGAFSLKSIYRGKDV